MSTYREQDTGNGGVVTKTEALSGMDSAMDKRQPNN